VKSAKKTEYFVSSIAASAATDCIKLLNIDPREKQNSHHDICEAFGEILSPYMSDTMGASR
jgi:hypothetical protein